MADKETGAQEILDQTESCEDSSDKETESCEDSSDKKDNLTANEETDNSSDIKDISKEGSVLAPDGSSNPATKSEKTSSSGDIDSKKSYPGTSLPSADEISDGEFSSLSATSSSDGKNVIEKDYKVDDKGTSSTKDSTEPATFEKPSFKTRARSNLNEHNFSDSDDSCGLDVHVFQDILESLRDITKPKEVDISKAVNKRPKRRRSAKSVVGGENSPAQIDSVRSPKGIQRDLSSSSVSCPTTPFPSSESSQDTVESVRPIGPTEFSHELISNPEFHEKAASTPDKDEKETGPGIQQLSIERSSSKTSDCLSILKYDFSSALKQSYEAANIPPHSSKEKPSADCPRISKHDVSKALKESIEAINKKSSAECLGILKYDASSALKKQISETLGALTKESPDSPPRPSPPKRREVPHPVPIQTPGDLIIADRLARDPHARRVNSLTALLDRLVDFSNYMAQNPLLTVPGRAPASNHPTSQAFERFRELEAAFRQAFIALQEDTSDSDYLEDEDEATMHFRHTILEMKDYLRFSCDVVSYSDSGIEETVPPSDDPVTIDEIREYLPKLWRCLNYNNMLMNQFTSTLVAWCLQDIPESNPQEFYNAETGVRALYGRIDDVRRSTARLMYRWRSRRMDYGELGDLTYVMTMASTAMSMYSTLESEVIHLRFVMGTRQSAGNRRRPRDESAKSDSDDSVKPKKGKKD